MSELFILYRDVKVTAEYIGKGINPLWEDRTQRAHFYIHVEGPLGKDVFDYWMGETCIGFSQQSELSSALWSLMSDAESGSNYDFQEFCSELGYEVDLISSRNIYDLCAANAERLNNISSEFDFSADREFLDESHFFHNNRAYSANHELWSRPSEAIILFDDEEIEATWESDRAHPGGESTSRMGDGWVDLEHRMPFCSEDVAGWTWIFSEQEAITSRYNIASPDVQLMIPPLFDDDDYYLTI